MAERSEHDDGTAGAVVAAEEAEIRLRAWAISQREDAGSPEENWARAIDELHAERMQTSRS
jgi:hypothetical protein